MAGSKCTAIVGAGMAGCAAARQLVRAGRRVVLFEVSDALGGRARSWHTPELESTTGLSMWIMSGYRRTLELIREYGLQDELVRAPIDFLVVRNGEPARISSESFGTVLRYPHLGVADRARLIAATLRDYLRRGRLDMFEPEMLASYDDGSTGADWARRTISRRALDNFIRAEIESLWLWRCEEVSAAHVRATHANLADAELYYLRQGMETLCERMVRGADLRLGTEVTGIAYDGGPLRITSQSAAGGDAVTEEVDDVVIATPSDVAAKLAVGLPAGMASVEARRFLESQRHEPVMLVTFLTGPDEMPPDVLIIETGDGIHPMRIIVTQPVRVMGQDGRFHDKLMTCGMPGREQTAELFRQPDDVVYERARRLMPGLWTQFPENAKPFHILREPQAMPWPEPGRFRQSARIARAQRGPVVFAGDYFCSPTTEAATRSGERAAHTLLGAR